MRAPALVASLLATTLVAAPWRACAAPDDQPPAPLTSAEAAGPWTLESDGRPICELDLGREKISHSGFALTVPLACGDALPSNLVAWAPAPDGVRLVGWDDRALLGFSRLGDGRLVSHRGDGADLQLQRGDPKR